MGYFMIGTNDYSKYISELKVSKSANYNAQTNAAGDTMVDYINAKRQVEIEIISLDDAATASLLANVNRFHLSITFLNPDTQSLEDMDCIIPSSNVEYYTIQSGNVRFKAFNLKFIEL